MRTTPVEVVWLISSAVGFVIQTFNYRTYRDDFIRVKSLDPKNGDSYRVNALLNTLRLISMGCLLWVSGVAVVLEQPLSEQWRVVNQLVLTAAVLCLTFIAVIIRRAVKKRSDR